MKRFVVLVAVLACAPAVVLRVIGLRHGPLMGAAIFGAAILAAGFVLSRNAEAAERHVAQVDTPGKRMTFHATTTSRRRIH